MKRRISFFVVFLAFTALLLLNTLVYLPFLSDDSLISMRYSARLVDGSGLTWTAGSPVEGYSNLLWVLLTAAGMSIGIDGVDTVRLLGILSITCFVFCVLFTYRRSLSKKTIIVLLVAILSAPLGAWAIGGLEQPLVAALLALSIPLIWRIIDNRKAPLSHYWSASIPLALLCITRPDGALFAAVAVLVLLLAGRGKRSLLLLVLPVFLIFAQLGFRLAYYGDYVPNTARIKMRPSLFYSIAGVKYLVRGILVLFPLSFFSVYATVGAVRKRHYRTLLPAAMAFVWMVYLIVIGGDIFPAYKHFVPLVILFTWICIEEFPKIRRTPLTVSLFTLIIFAFGLLQYFDSRNQDARNELWEWDGQVIALELREAFSEQNPLIAVTAAGSLPYWSAFPCLDMLGLNDRYLALNQGHTEEHGLLGHNVCNPVYILERKPDIISFNVAGEPSGLAVAESLFVSEEFQKLYSRVLVQGTRPYFFTGTLWFNRESSLIGIEVANDSIVIPAYFFNKYQHTVMHTQNGIPGIYVTVDSPAAIDLLDFPEDQEWIPVQDNRPLTIQLHVVGDSITIELNTNETEPLFVERVILVRVN